MKRRSFISLPGLVLASNVAAYPLHAQTPYEETVQYALENFPSGSSVADTVGGTRFTVMPVRTWKSLTGHYCRKFELTVTQPGGGADHREGIRCRDSDGVWKQVKKD